MLQEKWTNHTCIQDPRAVPWHWSHTPNQEHTLEREREHKGISQWASAIKKMLTVDLWYSHLKKSGHPLRKSLHQFHSLSFGTSNFILTCYTIWNQKLLRSEVIFNGPPETFLCAFKKKLGKCINLGISKKYFPLIFSRASFCSKQPVDASYSLTQVPEILQVVFWPLPPYKTPPVQSGFLASVRKQPALNLSILFQWLQSLYLSYSLITWWTLHQISQ